MRKQNIVKIESNNNNNKLFYFQKETISTPGIGNIIIQLKIMTSLKKIIKIQSQGS